MCEIDDSWHYSSSSMGVCVWGGGDSSNGEWKWTAVLERATVPAFPPSHTNELIC